MKPGKKYQHDTAGDWGWQGEARSSSGRGFSGETSDSEARQQFDSFVKDLIDAVKTKWPRWITPGGGGNYP